MRLSSDECGSEVLEVVPLVMRGIRAELRRHRGGDLSVPQFRTLIFLNRHEGASLSQVAEHIGLTLPSMSKMVDGLVVRGLTARETHPEDRRRMTLALTRRGRTTLSSAYEATEAYLRELFAALSSTERATIIRGMQILRQLFTSTRGVAAEKEVMR